MRLILALFMLLSTQLFFNLAHAAPLARIAVEQRKSNLNLNLPCHRIKKRAVKDSKIIKVTTPKKKAKLTKSKPEKSAKKLVSARSNTQLHKTPRKQGYDRHRQAIMVSTKLVRNEKLLKLSRAHKRRYQHAKQTAMAKLMDQMGRPYRWGGSSPRTGFDCSGLVYYAYKDVVNIKMPRTADEMYHLRDAAPIKKSELESGDLVFFRINNRRVADHVGVYLGNGKFIQSPRTGEEIRISQLNNDYWHNHYIGARRLVTPQTLR